MKKIFSIITGCLVFSSTQAVLITDSFTAANQTAFATNDVEIAAQIGADWKRANPTDETTQYRIRNNAVDIGTTATTKAMLVNTAADTMNAGDGTDFTLSAVLQQNTTAGSASIGLIFNYQSVGNYYLFRITGGGAAQFLVYSNGIDSTAINDAEAFTPVQNRQYQISISSSDPGTFDISVLDTVDLNTVYSQTDFTLSEAFVTYEGGLGGMYATSGLASWDDFSLETVPEPATIGMIAFAASLVLAIRRLGRS